jgi:hypothetical protein
MMGKMVKTMVEGLQRCTHGTPQAEVWPNFRLAFYLSVWMLHLALAPRFCYYVSIHLLIVYKIDIFQSLSRTFLLKEDDMFVRANTFRIAKKMAIHAILDPAVVPQRMLYT